VGHVQSFRCDHELGVVVGEVGGLLGYFGLKLFFKLVRKSMIHEGFFCLVFDAKDAFSYSYGAIGFVE